MGGNAREVALEVLTSCRKADAWAEGALKSAIGRAGLDSRDAALASRITYAVVQNRMLLDQRIGLYRKKGQADLEPVVMDILRIGACQILLMDKIPHSAAVNEAVEMAKRHHRAKAAGLVNAILRSLSRDKESLPPVEDLSVRFSHPQWLVDRYISILGREEAEAAMAANNSPVPTTVQLNTLRADAAMLETELEGAVPHTWLQGCYEVTGTGNLENLPAFRDGHFMVQDAAAKLVALVSGCKPGDFVIDTCAAPGGKSFGAAMAMENTGRILSCDIHPHKLSLIEKGAERLGITCIETQLADGREFKSELGGAADVVICDVPCSGLGIIRKKPDIRYKDPAAMGRLPEIQLAILQNAARYVKPGGVLIYSTCTVLPEENRQVVESFLAADSSYRKETFSLPAPVGEVHGDITLWPQRHQTDGFYICKLRKIHD